MEDLHWILENSRCWGGVGCLAVWSISARDLLMIKSTGQRCGFCNPALLWCTVFLTQTFRAPFFLANVLAMRKALPWTCRKMACVGSLPWGGSGGWVRYACEDGRNTGGAVSDNKQNDRKQNCLCQTSSHSLFLCLCDVWKSFCTMSLHWELQEVPHFFPGLGLRYGCLSLSSLWVGNRFVLWFSRPGGPDRLS